MGPNFDTRSYREQRWERRLRRRHHAAIAPAIVLIAVGAIFLLNNLHLFYFHDVWRYWPVILIALGIVKLVDSQDTSHRLGGGILTAAGAFFLAQSLGFLDISFGQLWPLMLIALGGLMLLQRTWPSVEASWSGPDAPPQGVLNEFAVFSGGKRKVVSQDFRGGELSAVFGGFEIDLRKAGIAGDSAVMVLNAIFGGMEVKVPENWEVVLQVTAVFGGCDDKTEHPDPALPGVKKLILRGAVVFGGLEVKN